MMRRIRSTTSIRCHHAVSKDRSRHPQYTGSVRRDRPQPPQARIGGVGGVGSLTGEYSGGGTSSGCGGFFSSGGGISGSGVWWPRTGCSFIGIPHLLKKFWAGQQRHAHWFRPGLPLRYESAALLLLGPATSAFGGAGFHVRLVVAAALGLAAALGFRLGTSGLFAALASTRSRLRHCSILPGFAMRGPPARQVETSTHEQRPRSRIFNRARTSAIVPGCEPSLPSARSCAHSPSRLRCMRNR